MFRIPYRRIASPAILLPFLVVETLAAQSTGSRSRDIDFDTVVFRVDPIVVTATRGPREVSLIPRPVSVVQRRDLLEKAPNTVSDLFRDLPGLDVTGVGVNQGRPQIRGQRGQRILPLADGLRLNNPLGDVLPSFTVMNLRSGITVWSSATLMTHRLNVSLTNPTPSWEVSF